VPSISFIVPVFNIKKYLPACINSIAEQPFNSWEIILVDDASTDGSGCLCDNYAAADKRISVIHMEKNSGPGIARNKGLLCATGEYVFFIDGDDTISSGELSQIWSSLSKCRFPDMMRVGYNELFGDIPQLSVGEALQRQETICPVDYFMDPSLRHGRVGFSTWEFVIRRKFLNDSGIRFGSSRVCEDNEFQLRSLFAASTIAEYGRVFYCWHTRLSGSLTSNYIIWWNQILRSAISMLDFANEKNLEDKKKIWTLNNVYSILTQFEELAGAIPENIIASHAYLFDPFEKHLYMLEEYIKENGLLWNIRSLGTERGVLSFCRYKTREAQNLLKGRAHSNLFGFPATRKCSRLLAVLGANGTQFKGILDNDARKHGLVFHGHVILKPEIIPICYEDVSKLFVIISTATRRTGQLLSDQLRNYGLEEGKHFVCTGHDID
jgi:glycosyltransferase involved in cell wall biosynthesis